MPIYAITGQATFSNKTRRDAALTVITNKAAQRGLVASAQDGLPAGAAGVGTTALTFSYITEDESIIQDVETGIFGHFHTNAVDGSRFSVRWVSD